MMILPSALSSFREQSTGINPKSSVVWSLSYKWMMNSTSSRTFTTVSTFCSIVWLSKKLCVCPLNLPPLPARTSHKLASSSRFHVLIRKKWTPTLTNCIPLWSIASKLTNPTTTRIDQWWNSTHQLATFTDASWTRRRKWCARLKCFSSSTKAFLMPSLRSLPVWIVCSHWHWWHVNTNWCAPRCTMIEVFLTFVVGAIFSWSNRYSSSFPTMCIAMSIRDAFILSLVRMEVANRSTCAKLD
mmetsp:Transcript_11536/g.43283  ORF Transcript_11536/g.43283 Transcript_11536/m.43283 type:complete len:242 (-) Transcript_11536:1918-2643(-)